MTKKGLVKKIHLSLQKKNNLFYIIFVVPCLIVIILGVFFPLFEGIRLSFYQYDLFRGINRYIGVKNYCNLLKNYDFLNSLLRNILYVIIVVSVNFLIGLVMAILFAKEDRLTRIFRGFLVLPMLLIPASAGVLWRFIYHPDFGIFNHFRILFGLGGKALLSSTSTAFYAILITDIWAWTPWMFLVLLGGIQSLPLEPIEASRVDGATPWQTFWFVTLPMLKPIAIVAIGLKAIDTFRTFDYVWVMTQGGPAGSSHILSTYIYSHAFQLLDYGYASAGAVLTFVFSIVIFSGYVFYIYHSERGKH